MYQLQEKMDSKIKDLISFCFLWSNKVLIFGFGEAIVKYDTKSTEEEGK